MSNYILAIESSTTVCSVALFEHQELVGFRETDGSYSHAENLALFSQELLNEHSIKFNQLKAIAVSEGPGSYTGLRIGVSFAKGLCYSLNIPLISVETLRGLAAGVVDLVEPGSMICPLIDARRMEVYTALFDDQLTASAKTQAKIIDELSFQDELNKSPILFVGDGVSKCEKVIQHSNASFKSEIRCSARFFGNLINDKWEAQIFEDVAYFEPKYHKEFLAIKGKKLV